jgi:hypothetical protein
MRTARTSLRKPMRVRQMMGLMVILGCTSVSAAEPQKPKPAADPASKPVSFWMEKKLQYTQDILRGLVIGDLDDVADKAEQMRRLSKVEGWIRSGKSGYKAQLQAFELANSEILRNARADRLDGATLAFQQLTVSCVSCHKILRNVD